jgi:multisubunit Na+/H+ antiporter MnhG subunit
MIRTLFLLAAVYLAVLLQEFIPPLAFLDGARVQLVPLVFCYAALWLGFPAMLGFALYTGLLSDLANLHVIGDRVEIGLGWSMLFYVALGAVLHFLRPGFLAGRWELHALSSGLGTLILLLGQYLMVCLRRESFIFDQTVAAQIVWPAVVALLLAPVLCLFLHALPAGREHAPVRRRGRLSP